MQYSFISAAVLALASSVVAQTAGFDAITSPTQDQQVAAGSSLDIIWQPANYTEGTATIQLLQGASPGTLSAGPVVKAGIKNSAGKFTWAVPSDLKSYATYGFTITLDGSSSPLIFQYSYPFHITGLSGASSGSSSASSGTVTVHLGTGTGYVPAPTTTSANSTISATASTNVTTSYVTPKPSSNVTLSTTITSAKSTKPTTTSSPTASAPPVQSKNAAIANAASGSLALIGGLAIAFAL